MQAWTKHIVLGFLQYKSGLLLVPFPWEKQCRERCTIYSSNMSPRNPALSLPDTQWLWQSFLWIKRCRYSQGNQQMRLQGTEHQGFHRKNVLEASAGYESLAYISSPQEIQVERKAVFYGCGFECVPSRHNAHT